ncbi:glycoside hydrolase family 16 protein [Lacinutrix undariae]
MKKVIFTILLGTLFVGCKTEENILVFEEQFLGNTLDTNNWNYELGDGCPNLCGWGNNERQVYTKENVTVKDGNLIITATKDSTLYRSGRITTSDKVEFQYGTVEVRAKLATGEGLWPAVWLLGSDIDTVGWPACGEIDMMEYVGKNPNEIFTTLHTSDSYGDSKNSKITINESIEEGFHIYKTNWTEDAIRFYIDDELVYTFSPEVKNEKTWPFNRPFYIILNMAIGGNFGGPEVDDSIFPKEFIVDYVKVYKS